MPHKVFWVEPIEFVQLFLRRYRHSDVNDITTKCPGEHGYHNGHYDMGKFPILYTKDKEVNGRKYLASRDLEVTKDDHRWPTKCDNCDYVFKDDEQKQVFQEHIYKRADNGQEVTLRDKIPGMMWDAWWYGKERGADGISLVVKLPNLHDWAVDTTASNCDSPCKNCGKPYNAHIDDKGWTSGRCSPTAQYDDGTPTYQDSRPEHKCWVRHGDPKTGSVHVDKDGVTCGAGAGSILSGSYHGFLHGGYLTDG